MLRLQRVKQSNNSIPLSVRSSLLFKPITPNVKPRLIPTPTPPTTTTTTVTHFSSQLSKLKYYWQEDAGGNEYYLNWKRNPVYWLIAINVAIYLLYLLLQSDPNGRNFFYKNFTLSLSNLISRFHIHSIFTSAFTHLDLVHIFFNMFMLYQMGLPVMYYLGNPKRFVNFYIVAAVIGSLGFLL